MQLYAAKVINSFGNFESGVTVTVYIHGTLIKASLYSDNGVTAKANPTVSDVEGDFDFYAANGQYDVVISSTTNFPGSTEVVTINDPSQPGVVTLSPSLNVVRIVGKSGLAVNTPADTNEDILATVTIPANTLGPNGIIDILSTWSCNNNANAKTFRIRLGGIGGTIYETANLANNLSCNTYQTIANQNATNSQVGFSGVGFGLSTSAVTTSALDTTVDQTIVFTGQKAVAGDTLTLNTYLVRIFYNGQ